MVIDITVGAVFSIAFLICLIGICWCGNSAEARQDVFIEVKRLDSECKRLNLEVIQLKLELADIQQRFPPPPAYTNPPY